MIAGPFCHRKLSATKPKPYDYPADPKSTGEHLRKRRLDLRLLQREVAGIVGVNEATIQNWETGNHSVSLSAWPSVLNFLGYDPRPPGRTIGEKLRFHREALGLSAGALAARWGVDPATVTKYELKPDRLHDHLSIPKIVDFLGYNPLPPPDSPKAYIRQARYLLGLSQRDMAGRLHVCADLISRWERGESCPSAGHLDSIATALAKLPERLRPPCSEHIRAACISAKRPNLRNRPRSRCPRELQTLGDHIRKRRLELGLSQAALAKQFGVNRNAICNWERSEQEPHISFMAKITSFLGYEPIETGSLASRLRAKRRAMGMKQAEFAGLIGVATKSLHFWETGARTPKGLYLRRIQEILEIVGEPTID